MNKKTFGEVLREQRIAAGFGLREFAKKIHMQPSNLSFIENGRVSAPRNAEMLELMASGLRLKENSAEWGQFFDAAARHGEIPADVRQHKDIRELLPMMCRSVVANKLTKKQIIELVERVKNFRPAK